MRRALVAVLTVVAFLCLAPVQVGASTLIEDVYAIPNVLGPAGGTVTVLAWETSLAPATCQIRFAGSSGRGQDPPILAYSKAPHPCQYTVAARVRIGALPVRAPEVLSFVLTVRNANASVAKAFTVTVERQRPWVDGGPPVRQVASNNWSGYVLEGGPYTAVTGTFQVPLLYSTAGCHDTYAEWAGVDGAGNQGLLQAGISEQMSSYTGTCTRHPQAWAWWEELPGPAAPFVTLAVRPGQWVTVTIAQIWRLWWLVAVSNDSTGKSISSQTVYDGPYASAEWVVEASSSNLCSPGAQSGLSSVCDMAAFAGRTRFTGVAALGPTKEMAEVDLVQHAVQVAAPSPVWSVSQLLTRGFDVTYSGLDRPPTLRLLATQPTMLHQRP